MNLRQPAKEQEKTAKPSNLPHPSAFINSTPDHEKFLLPVS